VPGHVFDGYRVAISSVRHMQLRRLSRRDDWITHSLAHLMPANRSCPSTCDSDLQAIQTAECKITNRWRNSNELKPSDGIAHMRSTPKPVVHDVL